MATPSVLAFDAEGRAIDFEVWLDDLQLFLQCDRADDLSLFDLTSGASPAPAADADPAVRSKWATRDAAARLAVRRHLPTSERAHFSQYKSAQTFLSHHPHRRPPREGPPRSGESIVAVGASRGDPRTPIFEGCSPSPLLPSVASAAAADLLGLESVGAASALVGDVAPARARGARAQVELEGAVAVAAVAAEGVGVAAGLVAGVVVVVAAAAETVVVVPAVLVEAAAEVEAAEVEAVEAAAEEAVVVEEVELVEVVPSSVAAVVVASARSGSSSSARGTSLRLSSFVSGTLGVRGVGVLVPAPTFSLLLSRPHYPYAARPAVAVSLADPSGGPVLSHFSTVLPCPAAPSGTLSSLYLPSFSMNLVSGADLQDVGVHQFTPASQRVTHCTDARTGRHLATFSRLRVAASGQVLAAASRSGPESAPCSCRLLSHETLLWHHRLGHPSLPRLRSMASRVLVSGLPQSLPPLPSGPGPSCVPTLHMDVWGPAPSVWQGYERYLLLVVDDYSRYTTVLPLRSKGAVTEVLIDWIREARLQLRKSFGSDFPVLRLHSDRGGEFSSRLLRTTVLNLHPRVSRPAMSPALLWTGKVGDASVFRVWGSRAFVRDLSADKLSPRAAPCVFLGFPTDAPGWLFYHPSSRRVLSSQDITFDESIPFYRLFPYRTPSLPPPPDFLVPVPPPVDPLPPQVPAPSGVSQVDAVDPVEPGGATAGGVGPEGATAEGAEPGGAERGVLCLEVLGLGVLGRELLSLGVLSWELLSLGELREWFARRWRRAAESGGAAGAGAGASSTVEGAGAAGPGAAGPAGPPGAGAAEGAGAEPTAVGPAAGGVDGAGAVAEGASAVPAASGAAARPRPYFVPLLQQVLGLSPPVEGPPPVQSQSLLEPSSPLPAPSPYTGPTGGLAERREPASRPASPVRTARASGRSSRQRPPPVPGTHRMSLRPSTAPLRAPLPSPPESSLPALADPGSDSLRAASPTVTRLLATVVTDPSFESTAASALVAELVDFAARCRLDYAASLVAESASVCPPSVGGECALGTDVLEDRQEELQCLAAASPHLASVLLAPEGDPDALDIPTPRTYVDAVPPPGANIVSGMWIFRVKRPPGSPPVFKARYVARGFSQRQGVDYFQTFSPTPKMTTLRVLLHIAAQRDYELHSLDFSTAFLQGSLHEEIWLRRPPGFTGTFPPGTQWSLRRPVYGLRQAPREWHDTLRTTLAALGFAPSTADPSLFLLRTDTSLPPFYILVYVDDLVFATADTAGLAYVKSELLKRHTCTDLGELRSYLGLQITRDRARRTITLTQSHMVQQVLQRFGFTYSSPQATPLPTRHSLSALPSDESVESSGPYAELVGCLMYLMTCTRPDLAYPLSILARYVAPGRHRPEHMAAAKRVLRYLCSTSGMGLVLGGRSPVVLTGHADASWADDQATQRSSQGYTFSLGSGSVSWRSTRSSSVLGSSCEAEIYAGAMAAQELRWLTYLLTDLGEPPRSPPVLYVDNKAMLALCREQRLEHRTKHIALRYFLARELQQRGQLRLAYVASEANTADVFTKALAPCDHQRFCTQLGLVPVLPHLLSS
ncbi:unnamed protein product [Closterium sp. NIES-64]|nr:unnamed protein product [Closterium sp. NIES-64]